MGTHRHAHGVCLCCQPIPRCNRGHWTWSQVAQFQPGPGLPPVRPPQAAPSLNLSVLSTDGDTCHPEHRHKCPSQSTACGGASTPLPPKPLRQLHNQNGDCACWRGERRGVNIKSNLLSFSHREKVSKNSPACQNRYPSGQARRAAGEGAQLRAGRTFPCQHRPASAGQPAVRSPGAKTTLGRCHHKLAGALPDSHHCRRTATTGEPACLAWGCCFYTFPPHPTPTGLQ